MNDSIFLNAQFSVRFCIVRIFKGHGMLVDVVHNGTDADALLERWVEHRRGVSDDVDGR